MTPLPRLTAILIAVAGCALCAVVIADPGPAGADVKARVVGTTNRVEALRAAIAAESARIRASAPAIAAARRRLDRLQTEAARQQADLQQTRRSLSTARDRLTTLISRQLRATEALRANLVAAYTIGDTDIVSVVLTANGFSDLLEQADFLKRVARHNARIMDDARTSRIAVAEQTDKLAQLQNRQRTLAVQLERRRDHALAVQTALLRAQRSRLAARAGKSAQLGTVQRQLASLRRKLAAAARGNIRTDPGGQAQAPPTAPQAVQLVIAAGNAIAGLPYLYGGGHAGFKDSAYDCSGSISYALASAGLVTSPMASGPFMTWGEPGAGKWITIYANPGHMFMVVAGWRFDTTALRSGGTRWTRDVRSTTGFTVRHPPGL